jgi:hypothetical protein
MLGQLYDVELSYDVYDYLVTDRSTLRGVDPDNDARLLDEMLLLAEHPEGAAVSLYLDAAMLERLEGADPVGALDEGNLSDYCTALEGVSHFVYATWRLQRDRPLSLLELEMQAEVDKYAITVFLLGRQCGGRYPAHVHARLFERVRFDARLKPEQYERYRTAHNCAARFCRRLEERYVKRGAALLEGLLRELRTFYRLGANAKLAYAQA